jgi:hypothetical protein
MYQYQVVHDKVFIVYEKCTGSLGEILFEIYEESVAN